MDSDGSRMLIWGCAAGVVLIFKTFFAFHRMALTEANDSHIKALSEKDGRYAPAFALITSPRKMILTLDAFGNFCAAAISVFASIGFFSFVAERLGGNVAGKILSAAILIIAVSAVSFIVSDAVPRRFAGSPSDARVLRSCRAIRALMFLLAPVTAAITGASALLSRLLGISGKIDDAVTEEQILMLVEAGNETGVIEENERDMISNILEFNDAPVSEVMTHRTDMVAVDVNMQIKDIVYLAINEGFSRIPVFEGSIDSIIGVIVVKDLLCLVGCEHIGDFSIRQFMREMLFVPETNKCDEVFEFLTQHKAQAAVVVDEYGGTAGMVTMEDLLEEIVGSIQDEYDSEEEEELRELPDGGFSIDGTADPEDILPRLGASAPEDKYDTMSALLVDILGRIPAEGEVADVDYQNLRLSASLIEDNWISRIEAHRLTPSESESHSA